MGRVVAGQDRRVVQLASAPIHESNTTPTGTAWQPEWESRLRDGAPPHSESGLGTYRKTVASSYRTPSRTDSVIGYMPSLSLAGQEDIDVIAAGCMNVRSRNIRRSIFPGRLGGAVWAAS